MKVEGAAEEGAREEVNGMQDGRLVYKRQVVEPVLLNQKPTSLHEKTLTAN